MAPATLAPRHLSDTDLLAEVARAAACERTATAALVALLAEMDARKLHLAQGCSSLFAYCVERLHLSEHAAYHRIQAARAATAFPVILEFLETGALTLTTVKLLAPHLTDDNHRRLLESARHRSTRDVEVMVRKLAPLPEVRSSVRKVAEVSSRCHLEPAALPGSAGLQVITGLQTCAEPQTSVGPQACAGPLSRAGSQASAGRAESASPDGDCLSLTAAGAAARDDRRDGAAQAATGTTSGVDLWARVAEDREDEQVLGHRSRAAAAARPAEIRILSPERYSLRVMLSAGAHAKLRRAQDLMRHSVPDGDPAAIIDRALTVLVEQLERTKFAAKKPPRAKPLKEAGDQHAAAAVSTKRTKGGKGRGERKPAIPRVASEGRSVSSQALTTTGPVPSPDARREYRSRHIPAAVKREVWARDEGRCAFTGTGGRCRETGRLEFHHRLPMADGGANTASNLELRCRLCR